MVSIRFSLTLVKKSTYHVWLSFFFAVTACAGSKFFLLDPLINFHEQKVVGRRECFFQTLIVSPRSSVKEQWAQYLQGNVFKSVPGFGGKSERSDKRIVRQR